MSYQFVSLDPSAQRVSFLRDGAIHVATYKDTLGSADLISALPDDFLVLLCRAVAAPLNKFSRP